MVYIIIINVFLRKNSDSYIVSYSGTTLATSGADFTNGTFTVSTSDIAIDQDVPQVCQNIQIHEDEVIERTEYFTVSLRRIGGFEFASCQVAILDRNGGKSVQWPRLEHMFFLAYYSILQFFIL